MLFSHISTALVFSSAVETMINYELWLFKPNSTLVIQPLWMWTSSMNSHKTKSQVIRATSTEFKLKWCRDIFTYKRWRELPEFLFFISFRMSAGIDHSAAFNFQVSISVACYASSQIEKEFFDLKQYTWGLKDERGIASACMWIFYASLLRDTSS